MKSGKGCLRHSTHKKITRLQSWIPGHTLLMGTLQGWIYSLGI